MKHFSEQTWADFVRGIGKSETSANIESHLGSSCSDCRAAFDIWKRVHMTVANEKTYTPTENLVRMVKQEFAARYAPHAPQSILAKLVFDTAAQPLPVGIRSGTVTARQLVYEAEELTVDLRLETHPQSNKICAVGQVLDKRFPRISPSRVSIMVWTERGLPVFETRANEFGEFHLEFESQDHLRLSIQMIGRMPIRIPLANLKPSSVAG